MLVSSLTRLDLTKKENMLKCEAVESKLVKLETSHTVTLPPNGECSLWNVADQFHKTLRILKLRICS